MEDTVSEIKVFSVGWAQQGAPYWRRRRDRVHQDGGLADRLHVRLASMGHVDLWLDCSFFSDRAAKGHVGTHTAMVAAVTDHWKFRDWIKGVKDELDVVSKFSSKRTAIAVVVCTSGVNRSPAGALVLKNVFEKLGYSSSVTHISKGSWSERNVCQMCKKCNVDDPDKEFLYDKAFKIWNKV